MKNIEEALTIALIGCLVLSVIILVFAINLVLSWLIVIILAQFGVHITIWTALGCWILLSAIANLFRSKKE